MTLMQEMDVRLPVADTVEPIGVYEAEAADYVILPACRDVVSQIQASEIIQAGEIKELKIAADQPLLKEKFKKWGYEINGVIDVYNSKQFDINGKSYLVGRAESREDPKTAHLIFYAETFDIDGNSTYNIIDSPEFPLEDPAVAIINGELVLSGVKVTYAPGKNQEWSVYQQVFYRGNDIHDLNEFAYGPLCMKDISSSS